MANRHAARSLVLTLTATLLWGAAISAARQTDSAGTATPSSAAPAKPLTLTGCVTADAAAQESYTFREKKGGVTYHLMGMKTFAYEGRRVRIVGGLYPSPNLAAQAGAIDPTHAAMAAATPGRMGTIGQPLEFRVTDIRPVRGACPPSR